MHKDDNVFSKYKLKYRLNGFRGGRRTRKFKTESGLIRFVNKNKMYGNCAIFIAEIDGTYCEYAFLGIPESENELKKMIQK